MDQQVQGGAQLLHLHPPQPPRPDRQDGDLPEASAGPVWQGMYADMNDVLESSTADSDSYVALLNCRALGNCTGNFMKLLSQLPGFHRVG